MHVVKMPAYPPHNNLDSHTRSIHALNDYFLTTPVKHFDKQESHLVSKSSALDGALTFPACHVLKAPFEGAGKIEGDTELEYLNRDGKDRTFQFTCKGRCADGRPCNRRVSFDTCGDHLDQYHDISRSKSISCPWCTRSTSRKNLVRHYQEVHLRFPRHKQL